MTRLVCYEGETEYRSSLDIVAKIYQGYKFIYHTLGLFVAGGLKEKL